MALQWESPNWTLRAYGFMFPQKTPRKGETSGEVGISEGIIKSAKIKRRRRERGYVSGGWRPMSITAGGRKRKRNADNCRWNIRLEKQKNQGQEGRP